MTVAQPHCRTTCRNCRRPVHLEVSEYGQRWVHVVSQIPACTGMVAIPGTAYDREVLVNVLVYHWRTKTSGCGCGWAELGLSHAEHVADVYEQSVAGGVS